MESNIVSPSITQSKQLFLKHASLTTPDGAAMSELDFLDAIAPKDEDYSRISREKYKVLLKVADRNNRGFITFEDWYAFERILKRPDAEYEIAFKLFDPENKKLVSFDYFVKSIEDYRNNLSLPFNWNSQWASLYIGGKGNRHEMTYRQFSQMLKGLHGERVRQAFTYFDKNNSGFITIDQFKSIVMQTSKFKVSDYLLNNFHTLDSLTNKISYATVRAFENLIREIDVVIMIAKSGCQKTKDGKINLQEFAEEATRSAIFGIFTPMEIELLFHFTSLESSPRLSLEDFYRVLDPSWRSPEELFKESQFSKINAAKETSILNLPSFLSQVFDSVYHFALGSVAGAFGATMVYPIDLVKTRMQNQRAPIPGQSVLYKNSIDCFKKVISREGFAGLYRGLIPQCIGVAPEKAIKLTVNDLVRGKAALPDGTVPIGWEILAGAAAGGCQVIFTNPLEIVKIRLQVQGELAKTMEGAPQRSALWIVKSLGLVGLYKGASACLLRDVPFSAIYFPAYAHLKKDYFGEGPSKQLGVFQLLCAGAIAGMPAAYFTTPFDVIKTRLQVEARKGQTHYKGLFDCARRILAEEGITAFFKGGPARVFRSSPQFGFTLATYELLQKLLPFNHSNTGTVTSAGGSNLGGINTSSSGIGFTRGSTSDGSEAGHSVPSPIRKDPRSSDILYLRSRSALKVLLDIDENFGSPVRLPKTPSEMKFIPGFKN